METLLRYHCVTEKVDFIGNDEGLVLVKAKGKPYIELVEKLLDLSKVVNSVLL